MNENQNNPEENLPGKDPEPVVPTGTSPASVSSAKPGAAGSSTNQSPKEMEVHHHGHVHEKKKWKEYGFQFLMLFLAVALGFAAEKFREHQIEKDMEEQYIESLKTDLQNDRELIAVIADSLYMQAKKIDTLQTLFSDLKNTPNKDSIIKRCYLLSGYIAKYYPINFNLTTITSLLSSGNLRLIKTKDAAGNILVYYTTIKNVDEQKRLYEGYINKCLETMYNVYDIAFLRTEIARDSLIPFRVPATRLLTTDEIELKKLTATMERAKASAFFLINRISEVGAVAKELLDFLNEKYETKKN